jgi:hypothetical protein
VDTGGIDPTHGGRTPLSTGSVDFIEDIRRQAQAAIQEADAVLFVNDGETGVTEPDREVAASCAACTKQPDGTFPAADLRWWSINANQGKGASRRLSSMNSAWVNHSPSPPFTAPAQATCSMR